MGFALPVSNSVVGGILLGLVVIIWIASSTVIQLVLESYPKPYLLTYITTSMFSCCLLSMLWKRESIADKSSPSLFQTAIYALKICPLWFFANYSFNISLNLTSIASNTILASTSGIFTLLFSILFLNSSSTAFKWLAVLISFGGVVCIGLSENTDEAGSLTGDIFALLGAILYAGYSVCLKGLEKVDTVLMFGCVGIINCFVLIPGIAVLDMANIEKFTVPSDMEATLILGNALIGSVLCDLMFAWSVEYLSPSICTLGLSLTIPLSIAVDYVYKQTIYNNSYFFGAAMIILGFVMITLSDTEQKEILEEENTPFIKEVSRKKLLV